MSVLDNVLLMNTGRHNETVRAAFVGRLAMERRLREDVEAAHAVLETVGLLGDRRRLAGSLSFGQQKLLSIAGCLASRATVLLLDEPVAGVEARLRERIGVLLREVTEDRQRLAVLVEHDLSIIRSTCEVVVALDAGRVALCGAPDAVLSDGALLDAYLG